MDVSADDEGAAGEAAEDAPQASAPVLLADEADEGPEPAEDATPAPRPAPRTLPSTRAVRRGGRPAGTSTAVTVTRLRAKHPTWTVGQIAAKAGVTDRTARRHLNAPGSTSGAGDVAA